jgi:hypothetical protein
MHDSEHEAVMLLYLFIESVPQLRVLPHMASRLPFRKRRRHVHESTPVIALISGNFDGKRNQRNLTSLRLSHAHTRRFLPHTLEPSHQVAVSSLALLSAHVWTTSGRYRAIAMLVWESGNCLRQPYSSRAIAPCETIILRVESDSSRILR